MFLTASNVPYHTCVETVAEFVRPTHGQAFAVQDNVSGHVVGNFWVDEVLESEAEMRCYPIIRFDETIRKCDVNMRSVWFYLDLGKEIDDSLNTWRRRGNLQPIVEYIDWAGPIKEQVF